MTDEDFAAEARRIAGPCEEMSALGLGVDCLSAKRQRQCSACVYVRSIALALRAARDRGFREGVEGAAEIVREELKRRGIDTGPAVKAVLAALGKAETCGTCKGVGLVALRGSTEDDWPVRPCPACSPRSPGTEGGGAKEEM